MNIKIKKDNVLFFVVENVDGGSIKPNHKIKNEVDGVLRIPVNDLLIRKPIKVPSKINPKAKVDLIYSHRLNIFLKRIQRKSSDYQYLFDSMFLDKGTFRKSFSKQNNSKGWRMDTNDSCMKTETRKSFSSYSSKDSSFNFKQSSYKFNDSSFNFNDSSHNFNDSSHNSKIGTQNSFWRESCKNIEGRWR